MEYTKIRKSYKMSVFLTDPRLRDMSQKPVEADAKRKFDMQGKWLFA